MLASHQSLGTWHRRINRYIVATEFYKRKFVASGLPADRISVKPHFVMPDPGARDPATVGSYALFIGRLDPEKGINTVLDAWKGLQIPLKVRGDESHTPAINSALRLLSNIEVLPRLTRPELYKYISGARFLLWPSEGHYETFGLVAAEAFACGVPVISSDAGIAPDIVTHGKTGMHFRSGDPADLRRVATLAWQQPALLAQMGRLARLEFEAKYTAEANARALLGIYASVRKPASRERLDELRT
jgi:glycosyltransferase involved in cell wall biosynthesis